MHKKVSKRRQISAPAKITKSLHIGPHTTLEWVIEGATARVIPVPADPIRAFRGSGKKGLVKRHLKERRLDRQRDDSASK